MLPVSVIIPTYNRSMFLPRAIESVLNQDDFNGEIIVVDDGSEDNTHEVVQYYSDNHGVRYRYIDNAGPAAARNHGVALSRYDLIAFLDSDDHWRRDKLQKQIRLLTENPGFSICHTWERWYRRGEHLNQRKIHLPRHGDIFKHCLQLCAVGMSTVLMRKALFLEQGGLDETLRCCEDYDLWLRISSRYDFLLLPEKLTVKEGGRPDQVSWQYRIGMDKYRIYAITKLFDTCDLAKWQYIAAFLEFEKKCAIYAKGCLKHGREKEGLYYSSLPEKYREKYLKYEKTQLD